MNGIKTISQTSLDKLASSLQGKTIVPGHESYDAARSVFYGGIEKRPAAVVRAFNSGDVQRVVSFAREEGIELAVRSGGHSVAGHSTTDGGIVLDFSKMTSLEIDAEKKTAWAESGLTTGEYTTAAAQHGLATGFGDSGTVGVGGITLGGGIGFLVRKYGMTIDALLEAEIITADGELRLVDSEHYPDLFWAIRGGGGNFGVATRFKFKLYPVKTIVGGMLILPATADVITNFVTAAEEAPEELTGIANIMNAPPMPFLPAEIHGKTVLMASLVYTGDVEKGKQAVSKFQKLAAPYVDMLKPMPYPDIYPPEIPGYHPRANSKTMFTESISRGTAETILHYLGQSDAYIAAAQIRVLGGAMARVPVDATAFAHRSEKIMVNIAAVYEKPEDAARHSEWVNTFSSAIPRNSSGAYVGFIGNEGEARVRDAYPGKTWERLSEIKRKYDPTNLFHLNQNIRPPKNI